MNKTGQRPEGSPENPRLRTTRRLATLAICFAALLGPGLLQANERPQSVPAAASYSEKGKVWVLDLNGKRTVYRADGSKLAEGNFVAGKRQGDWTFYFEKDAVRARGSFREGRMDGVWKLYHLNQKLASTGNYADNYRVGLWTFRTESGVLRAEGRYRDGYRWGAWKEYYAPGKIFYTGHYKRNKEHGEFKYYTETGRLVQAGKFRDGVRVGTWYVCAGGQCGKKTFKRSDIPRFSGGVAGSSVGKRRGGPNELLQILDGKGRRGARSRWR